MTKITIHIEGMHCGSCATSIEMLLSNKKGVKTTTVDFDKKEANVDFDSKIISRKQIIESINEIGYKAK